MFRIKGKGSKTTLQKDKNCDFEICVLCGKITDVPKCTPTEDRIGYKRGVGQLCKDCWRIFG